MNIGSAARLSGLPAKTIRYYEDIGLVTAGRRSNGYRDYDDQAVHILSFLKRARGLGFSIDDCRQLISLYGDRSRASSDVKRLAKEHLGDIDQKLAELSGMRDTLQTLVKACRGDNRPDCPILDDLAGSRSRQ